MIGTPLHKEIEMISEELDRLRFAGLDQNPKGIRDRLYWCAAEAKRLAHIEATRLEIKE